MLAREVLRDLNPEFARLYSYKGGPSIPPEMQLSALLLQVFSGIRSEIQLMEQLNCKRFAANTLTALACIHGIRSSMRLCGQ